MSNDSRNAARSGKSGFFGAAMNVLPLLSIPVIIYALIALTTGIAGPSGSDPAALGALKTRIFSIPMISGVTWSMTVGEALLTFALVVLSIEIVKSTSSKSSSIYNHVTSMIVLLVCIILFLLLANFATTTFFLLTVIVLIDVLVGVMVTIVSARRDFGVGDGIGG
jgi:hypothetical protein